MAALTLCLATITAQATLVGRSASTPGGTDYQAYYDTVLNITWLADANLGAGSIYDDGFEVSDGQMTWASAQAWVGSLSTANYLGVSNWRLPTTTQPDESCSNQWNPDGGFPLYGYNYSCTGSEMGFLFNVDGITSTSPTPFANVQPNYYWSGTEYAPDTGYAWDFAFGNGLQYYAFKGHPSGSFAWAVRDGDIGAVPAPPAVWLFGSALGVMGVVRRKTGR